MSSPQRRLTDTQRLDRVLQNLPGVQKSLDHFRVHNPKDEEYSLRATHPLLTKRAKSLTISAYKLYVSFYNQKVAAANRDIKFQMQSSKDWLEKQPKPKRKPIMFTQMGFAGNNQSLNTWEYNSKVDAYNTKYGAPIIPKRKVQTIKQSTEKVFEAIIWEYNNQLLKMKRKRESVGLNYESNVYKLDVNTKHLENAKGDFDLHIIDYCPDTILNHKNRLIEAGILINSQKRGSKRGTLHHICPEILVIFDDYDQKLVCAENQLLRIAKPEVFRDADIPTRAINQTIVKTPVDNSTFVDKDNCKKQLNTSCPTDNFTGAPSGKMQKIATGPTTAKNKLPADNAKNNGGSFVKQTRAVENSEFLAEKLEDSNDLAENLSNLHYKNTIPMPLDRLAYEAESGILPKWQFREVLLQDIFKQFSKLYLEHPYFDVVFIPVWLQVYRVWLDSKILMNPNGQYLDKNTMLAHYQQFIYCIINDKWGALPKVKKGKFTPPIPTIYLNPNNPTPGTFAYHFKNVQKHNPKSFNGLQRTISKYKAAGEKAVKRTHVLNKLNQKFSQFFNKRITDQELLRYVDYNMPPEIQSDFQQHFDNYRNNLKAANTLNKKSWQN